jgi:hypothetical protein
MSGTRLRIFHRHKRQPIVCRKRPRSMRHALTWYCAISNSGQETDLLSSTRKRNKVESHPTHAIRILNHSSASRQDIQITYASFELET